MKYFLLSALMASNVFAAPPVQQELNLRIDEGVLTYVGNGTNRDIPEGAITAEWADVGLYNIDIGYVMDTTQPYANTAVTCSLNTPSQAIAGTQIIGCYQTTEPIIRVSIRDYSSVRMEGAATINVKW